MKCKKCYGDGYYYDIDSNQITCTECDGIGEVPEKKTNPQHTQGKWQYRKNATVINPGRNNRWYFELFAQNVSDALDIICKKELDVDLQSGRPLEEKEIKANFKFMVKACNEHEKLKKEKTELVKTIIQIKSGEITWGEIDEILERIGSDCIG